MFRQSRVITNALLRILNAILFKDAILSLNRQLRKKVEMVETRGGLNQPKQDHKSDHNQVIIITCISLTQTH